MSEQPAIPAATLIAVREAPSGPPQLLMVERAAGMAFAGGALVWPGGQIDEADRHLVEQLGHKSYGAARVAAIRETIEETAVPVALNPVPSEQTARELQDALASDRNFGELLAEAGLRLESQTLTPFAHWIPKIHTVRRFDTLFFITAAPPGDWQPRVIEGECTGAFWITAADALERERRGEAQLIFPTRRNLERLAQHGRYEAILADARSHPLEPITPWVEEVDGEKFITIPDQLGYPIVREPLEGLWRG